GPNTWSFEIPTGLPKEVKMPGGLQRARRPEIPDRALTPEARIARGDSGLSPIRLTDPAFPDDPYRYYSTSGEGEVPAPKQSEVGTLVTQDAKQAQVILDRLKEYATNHPSEQRALAPAIAKLEKQFADYNVYKDRGLPTAVRVTPGKPGQATRSRGLKRLSVGAAGTAATGANERARARARGQEQGQQQDSLPPL
ncbi:MAG: hypothetical protein ABSA72_13370, partial [Nitrososphaerales archaeon]